MTVTQPGQDRTALVTGATAGIGRALAEALAAAGVTTGIVAREAGRGAAARTAIDAAAGRPVTRVFQADCRGRSTSADLPPR